MIISDLFQETYSALLSNKVRSGLTILGIVIGIGSVIAMVSVGQGASSSIQSSIQSIGSNLVMIMPGAQRGVGMQVSSGRGSAQTLKQDDADAIQKEITLAKAVAPELSGRYQITAKGKIPIPRFLEQPPLIRKCETFKLIPVLLFPTKI